MLHLHDAKNKILSYKQKKSSQKPTTAIMFGVD